MCVCFVTGPTPRTGNNCTSSLFIEYSILLFYSFLELKHFYFILRSLKRHIESTHAGQKYEGMDYVYPHKEKGRPRTKQLKYIDSSEVVYESEEQMDSYEMEDEEDQVRAAKSRLTTLVANLLACLLQGVCALRVGQT
jgi:hypothetical protein